MYVAISITAENVPKVQKETLVVNTGKFDAGGANCAKGSWTHIQSRSQFFLKALMEAY